MVKFVRAMLVPKVLPVFAPNDEDWTLAPATSSGCEAFVRLATLAGMAPKRASVGLANEAAKWVQHEFICALIA